MVAYLIDMIPDLGFSHRALGAWEQEHEDAFRGSTGLVTAGPHGFGRAFAEVYARLGTIAASA